jgi:hypothetical protein
MATTVDGHIESGFNTIYVFAKNTNGVMVGSDTIEPVAGAGIGTAGIRVEGAQTVPIGLPDSEVITVMGDDEPTIQEDFGESTLPSGILQLAARNLYLEAMLQGTEVEEIGNVKVGVLAPQTRQLADIAMLLGRRSKTWSVGDRGVKKRGLLFLPSVTLTPKGNADWTQRAHGPYQYSIATSKGNILAWGATFTQDGQGTDAAALVPVESNFQYIVNFFKGDGVQLTFTLTHIPVITDTTIVTERIGAAAPTVIAGGDYAITATPNLITFGGGNAPAAGAIVTVFIPVEENNL